MDLSGIFVLKNKKVVLSTLKADIDNIIIIIIILHWTGVAMI